MKYHKTKWNDDLISQKIIEAKTAIGVSRMPSESELNTFFRNSALTNAINRRGGMYHWANKLGLSIKKSETYIGKAHESEILELLVGQGYEVRKMPTKFPYDLLVDDCIKVDVKASRLFRGNAGNFYSFNLEKPYSTCDIYVLRTLSDDGEATSDFIIPSKFVITNTQISVGEKSSKYDKFKDRWDYISQFKAFLEAI